VTSFKTIYENTYTIFIAEKNASDYKILFKYIGYQPWESPVKGFLSQNEDFLIFNKEGMNFIRLDEKNFRRALRRGNECKKMVHSLSSMNYLKVEESNLLQFHSITAEKKSVMVQQSHIDDTNNISF
jgi:hypothetical protein